MTYDFSSSGLADYKLRNHTTASQMFVYELIRCLVVYLYLKLLSSVISPVMPLSINVKRKDSRNIGSYLLILGFIVFELSVY